MAVSLLTRHAYPSCAAQVAGSGGFAAAAALADATYVKAALSAAGLNSTLAPKECEHCRNSVKLY